MLILCIFMPHTVCSLIAWGSALQAAFSRHSCQLTSGWAQPKGSATGRLEKKKEARGLLPLPLCFLSFLLASSLHVSGRGHVSSTIQLWHIQTFVYVKVCMCAKPLKCASGLLRLPYLPRKKIGKQY